MEIIINNEIQAEGLKKLIQEHRELNQQKETQLKLLKRSLITVDEFTHKIDVIVKRQHKIENLITFIVMDNL